MNGEPWMENLSYHKSLYKCFQCIHPRWSIAESSNEVFYQHQSVKKSPSIYYLAIEYVLKIKYRIYFSETQRDACMMFVTKPGLMMCIKPQMWVKHASLYQSHCGINCYTHFCSLCLHSTTKAHLSVYIGAKFVLLWLMSF